MEPDLVIENKIDLFTFIIIIVCLIIISGFLFLKRINRLDPKNRKLIINVIIFIIPGIIISLVSLLITYFISSMFIYSEYITKFHVFSFLIFYCGLALITPSIIYKLFFKNKITKITNKEDNDILISEVTQKIFISYRRKDTPHVTGRIYDYLVNIFGKDNVYKDVDSIPLGINFKEHINNSVGKCKVMLVIIGDKWLSITDENGEKAFYNPKDYVRIEISAALKRDIPVIPVLIEDAKIPSQQDLPPEISNLIYRNGIQVRSDPDFFNDMNRLINALKEIIDKK